MVTEATLRIIPHPPARATFSVGFDTFADAAQAVQEILDGGFLPCALEISDAFTLDAARKYPKNTSQVPDGDAHLIVELDGQEAAVRADQHLLTALLKRLRPSHLTVAETTEESERIWDIRRNFSYSLRDTGLVKMNHDVVVPRSRLVDLANFSRDLQRECGYAVASFGHAGDGNIHVNLMVSAEEMETQPALVHAAIDRLFQQVLAWEGVITGEHGVGIARVPWLRDALSPVSLEVHRQIKQALDPKGILNPGKFILKT